MAEQIGTASSGHPNLNLTAGERQLYTQLFKDADPDGFGAVSGDVAVKFFEKTRLPPDVLGQIWQIADTENRGFLTPSGFGVVLRLIGHAQAGRAPTAVLATQTAPLPRFDGLKLPPAISTQNTGPTPASPSAGPVPIRVPALAPEKVHEYSTLFEKSGAENGELSGLVAKQIFERARLPNEVLGRIWNLSDSQGKGSLNVTEFVIAMHLLASYKAGAMRGVPSTLPPGLFEAASRRQPVRVGSGSRPASGAAMPGIPQQFTGFSNARPQSPITRQQVSTPLSAQSTGDGWLITPADKSRFDQIFNGLDTFNRGYITGDQAVEFFGNARLPEEILAQIWDLADINSEGQLNKDEFAVAMYLIRQQRGTRDGRGNLPPTLPPALVPPSMRRQQAPPSHPTAPTFENAPVTQNRSAADDLFGLDAFASSPAPTPAPALAQIPQSTGGSTGGPFANAFSTPPTSLSSSSTFKPFMPTSSFGQSIVPQPTGGVATPLNRSIQSQPAADDLLGDADPEVSQRLTTETSELANLSNQVGNLTKQTTEVRGNRSQIEQELSRNTQHKRDFEGRLAQLRTAYEQEVKEVKALQEQLANSKNDTKRLQQDMAIIDGSHQDLRTQHQQISAALQADQQENAALKEKIRQMNAEIEQLKPQLEKLKSDARQQKGLVAINKKQLATNEAERDRIMAEIEAARKEHEEALREAEETNRQVESSNRAVEEAKNTPRPAAEPREAVVSPTPSMSNPFFRRTTEAPRSPPVLEQEEPTDKHSAFDNIFGPSFTPASTSTAPTTSFRGEDPSEETRYGNSTYEDSFGYTTPIPDVAEPPAPPQSKQITSAALPFRAPLDRQDSISSSVKVAPSASRLSPADTPRALTPTAATTSPLSQAREMGETGSITGKDDLRSQKDISHVESNFPTLVVGNPESTEAIFGKATTERLDAIPGAFPGVETPRAETPQPAVHHSTADLAGTGAATLAAGAGVVAALGLQDHPDTETDRKSDTHGGGKTASGNFDDFFGGPAHQRTPSEQVKDVDSAFEDMKKEPTTNGIAATSHQEFPDIQEIEADDDSEDDHEARLGFDDNFNTSSPPRAGPAEVASAIPGHLQAPRPALGQSVSTASSLPGINSQASPPTYDDSVPKDEHSNFPPEFKGLLPSREDPTSPPPTAGGSSNPPPPPSGAPPSYGPEVGEAHHEREIVPPNFKSSPFDFDSAFAGMTPAEVPDDEDDDDDDVVPSQNHAHGFDPTFDTPSHTRSTTVASNQPYQPTFPPTASSSIYSAVTSPAPASHANGSSEFRTFGDGTSSIQQTPPMQSPATAEATANSTSHDWDAIFAGLDQPTTTPATNLGVSTGTTALSSNAPVTSFPNASTTTSTALQSQSRTTKRPDLGRALSDGTEHDDPILKRLTAMGWSRDESLKALEKYDYNIDKAADYLTFRT